MKLIYLCWMVISVFKPSKTVSLNPNLPKKGFQLSRIADPSIDYYYWNMQNPVVGGLSKEKIALRRAMAMAFSPDNQIKILMKGDAQRLQFPISLWSDWA